MFQLGTIPFSFSLHDFFLIFFVRLRKVPETKSPYDVPWQELSSPYPYTEAHTENASETALVHEPFFEEVSSQANVTAQLGSDVILHCKVNDLREKMVSLLS